MDTTSHIIFLKALNDAGHINMTWDEIAVAVGLENGEQARGRWRTAQEEPVEHINENNLVLNTIGPDRVISAEGLMDAHGIDRDIWEVARQSARKWDGYSKIEKKDLTWGDGGIKSGYVKSEGKINLVELYYIRIELVRKKPIMIDPVLPQVVIELPEDYELPIIEDLPKMSQHFVVYLPDAHFPYQNREALDLILTWVKHHDNFISHIIWGGDVLDLKELSRFTDLETGGPHLSDALEQAGRTMLAFKMAAPKAKHIYLEGNHEKRLRITLADKLPDLYGLKAFNDTTGWPLISVPNLLNLKEIGIKYVEDYPESTYSVGNVHYAHGTSTGKNGLGLSKALRETDYNLVVGHDHRVQIGTKRIWTSPSKSKTIQVTIGGWLGDPKNTPPPSKARVDWTNAFVITSHWRDKHATDVVIIDDGGFFFGGDYWGYPTDY